MSSVYNRNVSHPLSSDLPLALTQRCQTHFPLGKWTWFRVGGQAQYYFSPNSEDELAEFMAHCPKHIPKTMLGACSNVIIRDGGIDGLTVHLGRHFAHVLTDQTTIIAQAGCPLSVVANMAQKHHLGGLEFLSTIPGSFGGGVAMNAGAHGAEISEKLLWVDVLMPQGRHYRRFYAQDLGFSYRHSNLPKDALIVRGALKASPEKPQIIRQHMERFKKARMRTQPRQVRTGGSTFKNPPSWQTDKKAWQLVDEAHCRGNKLGDAMISTLHCNFMLNLGHATAADLENLGEHVRSEVLRHSGIELQWEIRRIGKKPQQETERP